ncbi:hypothetical protein B0A55_02786 [Friedmanniomyces simplex]|uniref:Terpene synthase n=1 Tax=Friedmanniomyces simplex TaxID=329884 RepID=A0A4U0XQP2_9PEZI|nr:hypothetical protein B0A55_02786 [Friedmanniomyces simplex]
MDKEKFRAMAEFHAAMYINNSNDSRAPALKNAQRDIAAIELAFPAVQDESILLAMAAWLSFLCSVDDEVERLDVDTAELALSDSATILTSSLRSNERSSQRYGGACLDPACDAIRAWTKNFIRQLRGLVPLAVYNRLIDSVLDVLEAMLAEVLLRQTSAVDIETYLLVRTRTVGLRPFFVLLQADLQLDVGGPSSDSALHALEANVTLAVALQNDIVGLWRDLAEGESFNIITLAAGLSGYDLQTAIRSAVDMHNHAASTACFLMVSMSDHSNSGALDVACRRYAASVCALVATHFAWASSAKRYA